MKIIIKIFAIFTLSCLESAFCSINAPDFFDNFYDSYLLARKISSENRLVLDFLHEISNKKVCALQELFNCAQNYYERKELILLIDEEYKDFLENIDFEISQIVNKKLGIRQNRKFKKAHRKFMRKISKCD